MICHGCVTPASYSSAPTIVMFANKANTDTYSIIHDQTRTTLKYAPQNLKYLGICVLERVNLVHHVHHGRVSCRVAQVGRDERYTIVDCDGVRYCCVLAARLEYVHGACMYRAEGRRRKALSNSCTILAKPSGTVVYTPC